MSKQVKIEDEVYTDLTQNKGPGETYSQLIARLLDIRRMVLGAEVILHGQKAIEEFRRARAQAKDTID